MSDIKSIYKNFKFYIIKLNKFIYYIYKSCLLIINPIYMYTFYQI